MLKKSVTFKDFNGQEITEDYYFHLSKAELIEMEMSHKGGLHDYLQRIVDAEDGKAIIFEFKELVLSSFGQRSGDGRRFIKTQQLRDEFQSSEAYSALFFELCTDAGAAAAFINGIVPASLEEDVAKLTTTNGREETTPLFEQPPPEPMLLTPVDILEMDSEELKLGLTQGRYKLAP